MSNNSSTNIQSHATASKAKTKTPTAYVQVLHPHKGSVLDQAIPASIAWNPLCGSPMPLIALLQAGCNTSTKGPGWHRVEERKVRGLSDVPLLSPLEPWEMEVLFIEILVLTGHSPAAFVHLAHAWGQPQGFHLNIGRSILGSQQQQVYVVSEEESETKSLPPQQENLAVAASPMMMMMMGQQPRHDLRNEEQEQCANKNSGSSQLSPLETLIALLASNQ